MEIQVKEYVLTDLAQEVLELRDAGHDTVEQEAYVRNQLTSVYDDHVYALVDSEENEELDDPYTFEEIVYELIDDIMTRADYYDNNRHAE
jgi:hypothetical protein